MKEGRARLRIRCRSNDPSSMREVDSPGGERVNGERPGDRIKGALQGEADSGDNDDSASGCAGLSGDKKSVGDLRSSEGWLLPFKSNRR